MVPTIHVLSPPTTAYPIAKPAPLNSSDTVCDVRVTLIQYLSTAFEPADLVAAEYLLLLLLSAPTARPPLLPPIGTLTVNFLRPASSALTSNFSSVVSSITHLVVPLPLSISLLHNVSFSPRSGDSSSLDAGLLQLGAGTVLIVEEDEMGNGGQLNEKATKNLQALVDCTSQQTVRYEYPYMDDLKMACHVRVAVLSEGKSLLPVSHQLSILPRSRISLQVDVQIPLSSAGGSRDPQQAPTIAQLAGFRSYMADHSASEHMAKFVIPDEVAESIQNDFVRRRQAASMNGHSGTKDAPSGIEKEEEKLKRNMRVAR